jgi:hypothetical protein
MILQTCSPQEETFEKCSILFKFKEGENFNHRNTWSILRIKLKLHFVQNVEPDTEIGQKGAFCKGLYKKEFLCQRYFQNQLEIFPRLISR